MPWTMNMVKTKAGKGPAFMGTVIYGRIEVYPLQLIGTHKKM